MTPLICASKFGSLDACRLLIQNGAQITKKSCNGQSPLHYAARKGHTRVLEVGGLQDKISSNFRVRGLLNPEIGNLWHEDMTKQSLSHHKLCT